MQKKRQFFRWIEEAEALRVSNSALLLRGDGELPFAIVATKPGLGWLGRIRNLFGNVDGCTPEPQRISRPVRPRPLPPSLLNIFD